MPHKRYWINMVFHGYRLLRLHGRRTYIGTRREHCTGFQCTAEYLNWLLRRELMREFEVSDV